MDFGSRLVTYGKESPALNLLAESIDENLTWCKHIDNISKKVSSGIGALK